ncbi:AAA family ATPase [Pseudanabaena sp. UWO310]|uniref:AAA family ATPase n=1 Tax=Pseudanabaena sp. UWO310 TaxID=2480795 RepID=UPI0011592650|nr:AAA family ATPase [Pseudanabaena sp. UWO310]TYQ30516.1 AAA family ATPase [Pseudanabaena sp. UWO310]
MKIRQLELKNFRCFDQKTFEFSDQFNVFIGDNGKGKTTSVEALALIIGAFASKLYRIYEPNMWLSRIQDSDIRQVRNNGRVENKLPVEIVCKSVINEFEIKWSSSLKAVYGATARSTGHVPSLSSNITEFIDNLNRQVEEVRDTPLPLIAYYGTRRLWVVSKTQSDFDNMKNALARESRFWGYTDCLEPRSNLILDWFKFEDVQILEKAVKIHQAISNALSTSQIDGWVEMNYDANEDTLIVRSLDGKSQQFVKLSDGVKNMIGMVADIAYRSIVLNPHLEANAPKETQGVVLIDEIDLHLHPNWQRRVVDDLKRTFPKIQFITTTHSEHIIQSLREGELIDLNNPDSIPAAEYENKSIEDIAENVMHVPQTHRADRYQKMMDVAERYYQMLENTSQASPEEIERLKIELDDLIEPYSDNVAYYAFLKMKKLAALGE